MRVLDVRTVYKGPFEPNGSPSRPLIKDDWRDTFEGTTSGERGSRTIMKHVKLQKRDDQQSLLTGRHDLKFDGILAVKYPGNIMRFGRRELHR